MVSQFTIKIVNIKTKLKNVCGGREKAPIKQGAFYTN